MVDRLVTEKQRADPRGQGFEDLLVRRKAVADPTGSVRAQVYVEPFPGKIGKNGGVPNERVRLDAPGADDEGADDFTVAR
ncbi:hypothetical protein GCM10010492_70420 [Saccharothrix mutabilis subsp. mutabilis]|uniref:Uncharacterized protein n=1 Tax=Saccharothrix mutabilis subsp. mutabilis TaxID=66855 RepID=A0ABN0URQ8_9PSEU